MNDRQRSMLEVIGRMKSRKIEGREALLVSKDLDRLARMVEAESALSSPSCDFQSMEDETTKPVHYLGLFIDRECLDYALEGVDRTKGSKDKKPILAPHITLAYKPSQKDVPRELFGKQFVLVADGYGYDEENEAIRAHLEPDVGAADFDKETFDKIQKMLDARGITTHVTLSISENGKAVNSKNLDFRPINPVKIGCVLGGHIKETQAERQTRAEKVVKDSKVPYYEKYRELNKRGDRYVVLAGADPNFASKVPAREVLALDQARLGLKDEFKSVYGEDLHEAAAKYEGREILFEHGDYVLSRRDGYIWHMNEADQKGWKVEDTPQNARDAYDEALKSAVNREKARLFNAQKQSFSDLIESKGLSGNVQPNSDLVVDD